MKWLVNLFYLGVSIFLLIIGVSFLLYTFTPLPDVSNIEKIISHQSIVLEDRNGEFLFDFSENEKRTYTELEDISDNIKKAAIAIEDANFYNHNGIQISAILRATIHNVLTLSFSQGGSTITQQVIKNTFLTTEKKLERKMKEFILARKLEKQLDKEKILEIYLNTISFGGVIYGVSEASKTFFNKKPSELSVAESAYLAAILNAPTFFSPYRYNKTALENRKQKVLENMLENGFITRNEYLEAQNERINFFLQNRFAIQAPHFVFFVRKSLEEEYGEISSLEGQKITTSLDLELQKKVEEIMGEAAPILRERYGGDNVAALVLSVKTGEILSMVGSRDFFDKEIDGHVNIIDSVRQPGSTFKPLVYATILERGLKPETILYDVPTQFSQTCEKDEFKITTEGCYSPRNYTGKFVGPINIRNSLAQSINIPAVKSAYLSGIQNVLDFAKKAGITTLDRDQNFYGLSVALGSADIKPIELAQVYSVFANEGELVPYTWEKRTSDKQIIKTRVLSESAARDISDILSDNNARAPIFGYNSPLHITQYPVAIKTGTTNNSRDIWVIGYSPDIVVVMWHGNTRGEFLENNATGLSLSRTFKEIFLLASETYGTNSFFNKNIENISRKTTIDIIEGVINPEDQHSILHFINKNNNFKEIIQGEEDPQYEYWEFGVQEWLEKEGKENEEIFNIPNNLNTIENPNSIKELRIISPSKNIFQKDETISIIASPLPSPNVQYEFYINENLIGSSNAPITTFDLGTLFLTDGSIVEIEVSATTQERIYKTRKEITIKN